MRNHYPNERSFYLLQGGLQVLDLMPIKWMRCRINKKKKKFTPKLKCKFQVKLNEPMIKTTPLCKKKPRPNRSSRIGSIMKKSKLRLQRTRSMYKERSLIFKFKQVRRSRFRCNCLRTYKAAVESVMLCNPYLPCPSKESNYSMMKCKMTL